MDTSSNDAGASDLISDTESVGSRTDPANFLASTPKEPESYDEEDVKRAEEFKA